MRKRLLDQQIRFCQEYIIDLNGKQAAIRAGYSPLSAEVQASQLLSQTKVRAYVQELFDDRACRTMTTADKVIAELYHLINFDPHDYYDERGALKSIHDIPKDARRVIASIETREEYSDTPDGRVLTGYVKKLKFWDKPKNLETLARHLKLLTDKVDVNVDGNIAITHLNGDALISEAKRVGISLPAEIERRIDADRVNAN